MNCHFPVIDLLPRNKGVWPTNAQVQLSFFFQIDRSEQRRWCKPSLYTKNRLFLCHPNEHLSSIQVNNRGPGKDMVVYILSLDSTCYFECYLGSVVVRLMFCLGFVESSSDDDDSIFGDDQHRDFQRGGRYRDSGASSSSFSDASASPHHGGRGGDSRPHSAAYAIPGNTSRQALADVLQSTRHCKHWPWSISDFKLVDTSFKKMLSILGNNKYIEIILDKQLITW